MSPNLLNVFVAVVFVKTQEIVEAADRLIKGLIKDSEVMMPEIGDRFEELRIHGRGLRQHTGQGLGPAV